MNLSLKVRNSLPSRLAADLLVIKETAFKHHPYIEQAIFRSVQEILDGDPSDLDLTYERFGKLAVLDYAGLVSHEDKLTGDKEHFDQWYVQCDCGKPPKKVGGNHLRTGNTRSCGCAKGRHGKRTEEYHSSFPVRFESWKNPKRFEKV